MDNFLELYGCDCHYCKRRVADKNNFNPFTAGIKFCITMDHEWHKQVHQKKWIVGYFGIDAEEGSFDNKDYSHRINKKRHDVNYCEHPICLIAYDKGTLPLYWRKPLC